MADGADEGVPMAGPAEIRIHLDRPAYVYPMFEQALRIAAGESPDEHCRRIGELWSQFSGVAAKNPHAWSREPLAAHQIWQPSPRNRMISWPYTKLMNSNNMVDQGAALVLTSAAKATYLQIPSERWVFPYSGTDSHDTYAISERAEFYRSPAIRIAGRRALELAGTGLDDMELIDIYSCFPSAVQVAANELGLPVGDPARPLAVTGGLTFAGGPWNNYVTHSIATMAEKLVANPGSMGSSPPTAATSPSTVSASTAPSRPRMNSVGKTSNPPSTANPPAMRRWSGAGSARSRHGRRRSTGAEHLTRRSSLCGRPTTHVRSR